MPRFRVYLDNINPPYVDINARTKAGAIMIVENEISAAMDDEREAFTGDHTLPPDAIFDNDQPQYESIEETTYQMSPTEYGPNVAPGPEFDPIT